jgi:8-oxo-dGTP pyrophosphatase MutT (NUDIX family)
LVSFPGGICDEGEFPIDAALRETWEELGIDRNQVDVLGTLTPLPDRVRTTVITPVLGHLKIHDVLDHVKTNPDEVAYAFTIPLRELLEDSNRRFTRFKHLPLRFPVFTCGEEPIWGLTAFILDVVLQVLEQNVLK